MRALSINGGVVGFWGVKVLLRTSEDVAAMPVLTELLGGELDWSTNESTGWALASLHGADYPDIGRVITLADAVGGPALVAYVADSDVAVVQFTSPGTEPHWCVLHADMAAEMGFDEVPASGETYAALVTWVGVPLDELAVTRALATELTFAEDTFLVLADSLGALARGSLQQYAFGSLD